MQARLGLAAVLGRVHTVKKAVQDGTLIPFSKLITLPQHDYAGHDINLFYAESWAIVYYLHLADGGAHRASFIQYVKKVVKDDAKGDEDFKKLFGKPDVVQQKVLDFLKTEFPD